MHVTDCTDYQHLSERAAARVIAAVERRPDLLLCAASGYSPSGLYAALSKKADADAAFFGQLRVVKLDEWGGAPPHDPGSCEGYLRKRLLTPLGISPDRYLGFDSTPPDPAVECERIRAELGRRGPIDVCILGLGVNGHVGFNEPGPSLVPHCHVSSLSESTRGHAMVRSMARAPRIGLTLGLCEILAARQIILLVAGERKEAATARLLSGDVSTTLPASFLWLHPDVECLIDRKEVARVGG